MGQEAPGLDEARARAHALLRKGFAPRGSEEPGIIMCGAHTGAEVFHTKLCDTVTANEPRWAVHAAMLRLGADAGALPLGEMTVLGLGANVDVDPAPRVVADAPEEGQVPGGDGSHDPPV
jgi:hypothetical protein